jgi:hypothetical protein
MSPDKTRCEKPSTATPASNKNNGDALMRDEKHWVKRKTNLGRNQTTASNKPSTATPATTPISQKREPRRRMAPPLRTRGEKLEARRRCATVQKSNRSGRTEPDAKNRLRRVRSVAGDRNRRIWRRGGAPGRPHPRTKGDEMKPLADSPN